jgi:uncharacterized OsmC-like protein
MSVTGFSAVQTPMSDSVRRVTVHSKDTPYGQTIEARQHILTADEPASLGGQDTGPDPYELLLSALGACTSMTLQMYAGKKGWPLKSVHVSLRHEKVTAPPDGTTPAQNRLLDRIEKTLTLEGDLSDEQRQRLREIADRCPVHQSLAAGLRSETLLSTSN